MSAGLRLHGALRIADGEAQPRDEWVIEETPVALLYNDLPFAVMMATPTDLDDFALGFALCEGIVDDPGEFALVDIVRSDDGIALHAAIPQARYDRLAARTRTLEGRSGCGLCGAEALQSVLAPLPRVSTQARASAARIHDTLARMTAAQALNARSGGAHAAACAGANADDDALLVREDVGRHNAVDKVVGACLRARPHAGHDDALLAVTSRASFEIVRKAARAGIGIVAAVSAPTDLAIRQADAAGIALVAFARDGRMTVYSRPERIEP